MASHTFKFVAELPEPLGDRKIWTNLGTILCGSAHCLNGLAEQGRRVATEELSQNAALQSLR